MRRSLTVPPPSAVTKAINAAPKRSNFLEEAAIAPLIAKTNVPTKSRSLRIELMSDGNSASMSQR